MQPVEKIRTFVEQKTGACVGDMRPFAVGQDTALYLMDLSNGERLVAKIAKNAHARLDIESWMLRYLKEKSALPVPGVVWGTREILLMTYIPSSGTVDSAAEENAADLLASLHRIRRDEYGLSRDTLIGPLRQPNKPSKDWIEFFREQRLLYMARGALEEERIDQAMMKKIETLAGRLDRYIEKPSPPSLLHGDVWGGNVLAVPGKISGFIDPAIYYGDPEIELAFSTLFGTFGESFFRRYHEKSPIQDGFFEVRKDLYNLYPLLVHARLFGRTYVEMVGQIVNRLVS